MQDRYFGDFNDFLKYALLRRLCKLHLSGREIRLGVCWYLTDPILVDAQNKQRDGHRVEYLSDTSNWRRRVDPELFDGLRRILVVNGAVDESRRSVASLESAGLLPKSTVFVSGMVAQQPDARGKWHKQSLEQLGKTDLVFLDPDNSVSDLYVDAIRGGKWAAPKEVIDHWSPSRSVMWISHPRQRSRVLHHQSIMATLGQISSMFCSVYLGHCGFHFLLCDSHVGIRDELRKMVSEGIRDEWGTCRYYDSSGHCINAGEEPTAVELGAENVSDVETEATDSGQWQYHEVTIINDHAILWRNRNPWLIPDSEYEIAFLLVEQSRILTVRFMPFRNEGFRNGIRPLDHPENLARWAEVSEGATNRNVRVYRSLVRELPV